MNRNFDELSETEFQFEIANHILNDSISEFPEHIFEEDNNC